MTTPENNPAPEIAHTEGESELCNACTSKRAQVVSLRWEFRRHHLSEHERLMADWLLDLTLVRGRTWVKIYRLADLGRLSGIETTHVCRALRSLVEMRIVLQEEKVGFREFSINHDVESWKCRFRQSRVQVRESLQVIDAGNGADAKSFDPLAGPEEIERFFRVGGEPVFMPTEMTESVTESVLLTALHPVH